MMRERSKVPTPVLAALAALAMTLDPGAARADFAQLLADHSPPVVAVHLVLQIKASGSMAELMEEPQEVETEASCVLIDAKGLVLCSNTEVSGYVSMLQRMMGQMAAELTAAPTRIQVTLAGDAKPLPAKLLARDTDLDLAWLRIEAPAGRSFPFFDLARAVAPKVGDPFLALRRMDRYFDRTPALLEGRIGGIVKKPRTLYVPASGELTLGLPVVTPAGEVIGITVLQLPDEAPPNADGPFGMMGWSGRMQKVAQGLILPAADIVKATQRAEAALAQGAPAAETPPAAEPPKQQQ